MYWVSLLWMMVGTADSVYLESGRVEFAADRHLVSTIRFNYFGQCTAQQAEIYYRSPFMRIEYLKIEAVRKELDLTPAQEAQMQKLIDKEQEAKAKCEHSSCGCFGRIRVSPWVMLVLDLGMLFVREI